MLVKDTVNAQEVVARVVDAFSRKGLAPPRCIEVPHETWSALARDPHARVYLNDGKVLQAGEFVLDGVILRSVK